MNEKYEDPFLDKEIQSEPPASKKLKPHKNFWEKFTVEIEVKSIRKLGIYLAGFIAAAALIWAGWTYLPNLLNSLNTNDNNIPVNNPDSTEVSINVNPVDNIYNIPLDTSSVTELITRKANSKTVIPSRDRVEVINHEVVLGDTLFELGYEFDLDPTTILWGNRESLGDDYRMISVGLELNILPTDGVYHKYKDTQTIEEIAEEYDVSVEDIINYPGNNIDPYEFDPENPGIPNNSWLIIPGGVAEVVDWGPPSISRDNPAVASYYGPGSCGAVPDGAYGTLNFYWPTVSKWISGYDWNPPIHEAIDIGGVSGTPIMASDHGVIVYAGDTNNGYGKLVVIDHGWGWQTAYAHLAFISVPCGQSVWRGDNIGGMGTTGNSTGVHLHFEIKSSTYGRVNPWLYLVDSP